jgi:hypothetical protein
MSKLAHSHDGYMAEIERYDAIQAGELRKCKTCGAEACVDNPDCPLNAVHCEFYTVTDPNTKV